jgi:hypothetical protein
VFGGEKGIDGGLGLKLSHNACQRRPVVMNLGFHHAALTSWVVEELQHRVERLLGILQYVSECPALTVLKKMVAGQDYSPHFRAPFWPVPPPLGICIMDIQNMHLQLL